MTIERSEKSQNDFSESIFAEEMEAPSGEQRADDAENAGRRMPSPILGIRTNQALLLDAIRLTMQWHEQSILLPLARFAEPRANYVYS